MKKEQAKPREKRAITLRQAAEEIKKVLDIDEEIPTNDRGLCEWVQEAKKLVKKDDPISAEARIWLDADIVKQSGAEEPAKGAGKDKPKAKKSPAVKAEKKHPLSRAETFAAITKGTVLTEDEITTAMKTQYGGSATEAEFQTAVYIRLLLACGYVKVSDDGKISRK